MSVIKIERYGKIKGVLAQRHAEAASMSSGSHLMTVLQPALQDDRRTFQSNHWVGLQAFSIISDGKSSLRVGNNIYSQIVNLQDL